MNSAIFRKGFALVLALGMMVCGTAALAHTPLCTCYDNMDGTATCEGGFSDGSSAAGVSIKILDTERNVLIEGAMGDDSTFVFEIPEVPYLVLFDAGPGHSIEIKGEDVF